MMLLGTLRLLTHLQATPQKCSPLHTHTHTHIHTHTQGVQKWTHSTKNILSQNQHWCAHARKWTVPSLYPSTANHMRNGTKSLDARRSTLPSVPSDCCTDPYLHFFKLWFVLGAQLQVHTSTIFELCAHSQIPLTTIEFMQHACQDNLDHFVLRSASWVWYWTESVLLVSDARIP